LRGYLIRLTRGYTDGGMDSRAEKSCYSYSSAKNKFFADEYLRLLLANVRSAVHVSMGEAGVTFAKKIAAFA
jgi:hypothetical protein